MGPRRGRTVQFVTGMALLAACSGSAGERDVSAASETVPTLYWLDVYSNAVHRATGPDFEDAEVLVAKTDQGPDGIGVDLDEGHLYWTSMGDPFGGTGQLIPGEHPPPGTLQRANLDGTGVERIVEPGLTRTPKQLALDLEHDHVYWTDRDAGSVWRAGLDGSDARPVVTGHGLREPVGIALDVPAGHVYFSDRSTARIWRAGLEIPAGQAPDTRTDLELVVVSTGTSMPVDLAIDAEHDLLYWTDLLAGSVRRAGLELPPAKTAETRTDVETLVEDLLEPIGISLDVPNDRLYVGELGRGVSEASLDGEDPRRVGRSPGTTGVLLVHQQREDVR